MITKIILNNIASYKHSTSLNTDKYVNLIYGLNGCGKSTFSNYLRNLQKEEYSECSIEGFDSNQEIIVYNTDFVQENFYESEQQKGIFTLSKENKDAEKKITQAEETKKREEELLQAAQKEKEQYESDKSTKENDVACKVWEIKTKYSGGDHVLEYCLGGLKSNKTALLNHLLNIVEYFFNFVEKTDLNNCFQKPELSNNRYQSLYRYINRESHSVGQNIYDFKELNYADMKDAFRELFMVTGYEEHYNKMYGANK